MNDGAFFDPAVPGSVRLAFAARTDVGLVRATNEDSVLTREPVFVVADGMGGHDAGEVASAIAVEEFERLGGNRELTPQDLERALRVAETRIESLDVADQRGAGTTVAAVATINVEGTAHWAVLNLGDSRVYRLSSAGFEQISVDHSVVQELVARGDLTEEEARSHPYRHMVTRALGANTDATADYWLLPVEVGDRILLCSDGLSGEVSDAGLERNLRSSADLPRISDALVHEALDAGGHDNVSVIVIEALALADAPEATDTSDAGVGIGNTQDPGEVSG